MNFLPHKLLKKGRLKNPRKIKGYILAFTTVFFAGIGWHIAVYFSRDSIIPGPISVLDAVFSLLINDDLFSDIFSSLTRVIAGFFLAAIAGIFVGSISGVSQTARHLISNPLELLRPIPPIAWIPFALVAFGIGHKSAIFVIFIGGFFPIFTNTLLGINNTPKKLLEAGKVLGFSSKRRFKDIIWPSALPSIISGLVIGLGICWMCVIAAEMISARSGLGYQIQLNRQLLMIDKVIAYMLIIGLLGFCGTWLASQLQLVFVPWLKKGTSNLKTRRNEQLLDVVSPASMIASIPSVSGAEVEIKNLTFGYTSDQPVVKKCNLAVSSGESVAILGSSGCGKSTLLRLLIGLESPDAGGVYINGENNTEHYGEISLVFQDLALFPWMTVKKNIQAGFKNNSCSQGDMNVLDKLIDTMGLTLVQNRYPHQISGGQQQRVALLRSLISNPSLLLMDEPFSSLDIRTRNRLQKDVLTLVKERNNTLIFVTHDIREAVFMADRIIVMPTICNRSWSEYRIDKSNVKPDDFRASDEFLNHCMEISRLLENAEQ
jgi:ABC-type nitrate/sulfonate/bicarbonate transport system ATPase subunit/ABC-type nitrate/sulfonate/bicarbonate transport system permease component